MQRLVCALFRQHLPSLVLAAAAATAAVAADTPKRGDVVRMKSGDVVTGKIEKVSDEELTIDPDFADAFDIDLKYIASIETTRPVKVTFKDGRELTGFVELDAEGKMHVRVEPSRWETKHSDDLWVLDTGAPPPAPGSKVPLPELSAVQELEVAYYRYEAEIGVGFNAASGNTESSSINLNASIEPSWGPNTVRLDGSLNRQEANDTLSAENWNVNLRYERDLSPKWYALLFSSLESDPFQSLDRRSSTAAGGGYRFYDLDPTHFSVALGVGYVRENFTPPSADRDFAAVVWALDFERDLFSGDFTLYHNHRLIQSLSGSELLLGTTQGIKLDLFDDLDLKLEFDYDYASDPAAGVLEKSDFRYLVKLDYSFEGDETDWLH